MVSIKKFCTVLAATCAISFSSVAVATAGTHTDTNSGATPNIIGGSVATSPWAVQLRFNVTGSNGISSCTGEQLNAQWVLTAKHCIDGASNMQVYHSNDQLNPVTVVRASRVYAAPSGDIALVQLDRSVSLPSYARLDFSYSPRTGDTGTIVGYGLGPMTNLRLAYVWEQCR